MFLLPPAEGFAGNYDFEMAVSRGVAYSADRLAQVHLQISKTGQWTLLFGDSPAGQGVLTVHGNRFTLDYSERSEFDGRFTPRTHYCGVWVREAGKLILSYQPGREPPKKFASAPDSEVFVARLAPESKKG